VRSRFRFAHDQLGKHPVSPGALLPIREQLGDLLLESGRPKEAFAAFEAALKIYPGRLEGLYGAGLSAERMGDKQTAVSRLGLMGVPKISSGAFCRDGSKLFGSEFVLFAAHRFLRLDEVGYADKLALLSPYLKDFCIPFETVVVAQS